jgi:hypothetical protein
MERGTLEGIAKMKEWFSERVETTLGALRQRQGVECDFQINCFTMVEMMHRYDGTDEAARLLSTIQ